MSKARPFSWIVRDIDKWAARLTLPESVVLYTLAGHADTEGACFPAVSRLVGEARLSDRGVRTALHGLRDKGILTVQRKGPNPSGYTLDRAALETLPVIERSARGASLEARRPARRATLSSPSEGEDRHVVPNDRHVTTERSARGATHLNTEETKKAPKKKPSQSARERARREPSKRSKMTEDWQPNATTVAWLTREGFDVDATLADLVLGEFRDHWIKEGELKASWDAAFKNRLRDLKRYDRAPLAPKGSARRLAVVKAPPAPEPTPLERAAQAREFADARARFEAQVEGKGVPG